MIETQLTAFLFSLSHKLMVFTSHQIPCFQRDTQREKMRIQYHDQ